MAKIGENDAALIVDANAESILPIGHEDSKKNVRALTAEGLKWSALDNIVQQGLSFIIFALLARMLSPSLFGIVNTSIIAIIFLKSTLLNSIETGLVVLKNPQDEDYDSAFWLSIALALVCMLIANLAAGPVARANRLPEMSWIIRVLSILLLVAGLTYTHYGWSRKNFRFRAVAMRNSISTAGAGLLGIGVAYAGYGLTGLIVNQLVAACIGSALIWRATPWRPKLRFRSASAKRVLATSLPLGVNGAIQFLASNMDAFIITYLLGPAAAGAYLAGKRVVLALQTVLWQPISSVVLPAFAEIAAEPVRLSNAIVRVSQLVMMLTAPLFAGVALTASVSVQVLFGPKWSDAAPIMAALAGFGLLVPSLSVLQQIVMALGRSRIILLTTLMQMVLSIAAIAILGQPTPLMVAICLTGPVLVAFVVTLIVLTRITMFPFGRYCLAIGRPLACTAIMAGAVLLVPDLRMGPLAQLMAMAVAGGVVYVAASAILAREAVAELSAFARTLMRKRGHKEQAA